MRTTFFLIALTAIVALGGCSKSSQEEQTATIQVHTVVCETCSKTIKNALARVDGVESVEVDIEGKVAVVKFLPEKANVGMIENAIVDAGYDANNVKRNPEAYERLPECCKVHE
jgi:copper chaperone CopZ